MQKKNELIKRGIFPFLVCHIQIFKYLTYIHTELGNEGTIGQVEDEKTGMLKMLKDRTSVLCEFVMILVLSNLYIGNPIQK